MNIFFLDRSPVLAARYHCDKHVVKMILETAQILSTAHHVLDPTAIDVHAKIYRKTHVNHPSTVWARTNESTYWWTFNLLQMLCMEYTHRYGKQHKTADLLDILIHYPANLTPDNRFIDPPQCMPDEYKVKGDPVEAYRRYYAGAKKNLLTYKNREKPEWISALQVSWPCIEITSIS